MALLLRQIARTAVFAGTADIPGRIGRRQSNRWAHQVDDWKRGHGPYSAHVPGFAVPRRRPSADQLRELGELKAAGVLTEAEFEVQKAKLLAS